MFSPAVAVKTEAVMHSVVVFGSGLFGQAVACALSVSGHVVNLVGSPYSVEKRCHIWSESETHLIGNVSIDTQRSLRDCLMSTDVIVLAVSGIEYGATVESLAPVLKSGQTIIIMGAAFGAALEFGRVLIARRSDLAVNIVETSQPFTSCHMAADGLVIQGLKERMFMAGRTINETRVGLSRAGALFPGLVPASSVIERGFVNLEKWLVAVRCLFAIFGSDKKYFVNYTSTASVALEAALRLEFEELARAYGISRIFQSERVPYRPALSNESCSQIVELAVIEDLVLVSSLARLVHLSTPLLDAIIDLAVVATGMELRNQARQLADIGLANMNAREIIELVSA